MNLSPAEVTRRCLASGEDVWLSELQTSHAKNDLERLYDWAADPLSRIEQDAMLARLNIDLSPLIMVPGCAGLHLPNQHPLRDIMLQAFMLEIAAIGGWSLSLEIPSCASLILPFSGIRLHNALGRFPVVCNASTDRTLDFDWGSTAAHLRWVPGASTFQFTGSDSIDITWPDWVRGVRFDSPAAYDFRLAGSKATVRRPGALKSVEYQTISTALQLLELGNPAMASELSSTYTCVTGLSSRPYLVRQSYSVEALPRIVYCALGDPFELADVISHEYHHLRLFLIEENHQLLRNPFQQAVAPWRKDLRTARGVFHGLYVFFMLSNTMGHLFDQFQPSYLGLRKLLVWRTAVDTAVDCLRQVECDLTPVGAHLLDEIEGKNRESLERVSVENPDLAGWIRGLINDHVARVPGPESTEPWYVAF